MIDNLSYEPVTGKLFWIASAERPASWNARFGGAEAFTSTSRGYKQSCIDGKKYYAHRVAWRIHFGEWPPSGMQIDHINGDRSDNRICNLRLATAGQNGANRKKGWGSSSYLGVSIHTSGKWTAAIQSDGKSKYLGLFETEHEAALAYRNAAKIVHGEFAGV